MVLVLQTLLEKISLVSALLDSQDNFVIYSSHHHRSVIKWIAIMVLVLQILLVKISLASALLDSQDNFVI